MFLARKCHTVLVCLYMSKSRAINPTQPNNTRAQKEKPTVRNYNKALQAIEISDASYAVQSHVAGEHARGIETSFGSSSEGVDNSQLLAGRDQVEPTLVIDKSFTGKGVQPAEWGFSQIAPNSRVGKSLEIARESAELIALARRAGCTDREKVVLFTRFTELNWGSARGAFLAELRGNLGKRGFREIRTQIRELCCTDDDRTESIVDGQVLSLLRLWFFDPSFTKRYDPAMGVLLSTYRRHDILKAIREVVRECVPLAEVSSDDKVDETEDRRENLVFRAGRGTVGGTADQIFAFDEFQFATAFEAQAECAEETVCAIAAGDYKQSECFRQLLIVLEDLSNAGKLSIDTRRAFILSIVNNSTVSGEIVGRKPGAIRQAARRLREKLHAICDQRGDCLYELKELLVALELRSN